MYINGEWVGENLDTIEVVNPATGAVPNGGEKETRDAIKAAEVAFSQWSKVTANERAIQMMKWHDLILENKKELAKLITEEMGKPADQTPLTAIRLAQLAEQAGIPKGVINIVTGDPQAIGKEMTSNPIIKKLTFTGSTEVGKLLMRQSADNILNLSLELGGHAPMIILDDADLDKAVTGVMV